MAAAQRCWSGSTDLRAGPRPLPARTASRAQPSPYGRPVRNSYRRRDRPAASGRHLYRPQVAPPEAGSGPIADQLSRTLSKAEETHQVTEDAIRRAALPGTGLGAMRPCADGHNDVNRQSTVRLRLMLLGQAQGCGLTPLCNRWSEAYPPQWDRKEAAQRRCSDSQQEAVSRPHPYMGYVRLGCQLKPGDWRFCWSRADLWAWLDLNQRPHPYQGYRGLSAVRTGVFPGHRRASGAKGCVLSNLVPSGAVRLFSVPHSAICRAGRPIAA
jgi:hypothetical protein